MEVISNFVIGMNIDTTILNETMSGLVLGIADKMENGQDAIEIITYRECQSESNKKASK
jgi:hypothetical protein